ncbi:MAG: PhzF family phenazine biosynthesis protein [Bacteroidetes bacterium]|nr:PhzF family phenazine biosynthesis protein [Bacteroidota bacterium]
MKRLTFCKFDAFASTHSTGNPAASISLENISDLNDSEMLSIAEQLKGFVNEVAFISKLDDLSFKLKYFSAEREVDFCGHATIGLMYNTIKNNQELLSKDVLYIETNKGRLPVYNAIESENAVYIGAPLPEIKPCPISPMEIFKQLNLTAQDIDIRYPFQLVNAGLETLVLPITKLETLLNLRPNEAELKQFCLTNSIDIIALFSTEVANDKNFIRSRVFAPTFGYLEDPATGSGNSAIGYYMLEQRFWNGKAIQIEQNNSFEYPNIIKIKVFQNKDRLQVLFGGSAIIKIEGGYFY